MNAEQIQHHYGVEVELAGRLRRATKAERLDGLYSSIYAERLERIPAHPLLIRARDPVAQAREAARQLRLLAPFLDPAGVFLEVGPGDCALAFAVASCVKFVYAVDVTDALIGDSPRPENFEFVHTNGVAIPLPGEAADVAYSNQVLEHLHPDDAYDHLQGVHAALVPGGRLICVTPNRLSGPWDISRHFDETATGLHLKEYTLSELADLLRSVGFTVDMLVSYHGRHLLTHVPEPPLRGLERALARFPRQIGRRAASGLVAVKVLATKPR